MKTYSCGRKRTVNCCPPRHVRSNAVNPSHGGGCQPARGECRFLSVGRWREDLSLDLSLHDDGIRPL